MNRKWIVAQIGAREHYGVARALHRRGKLRHLYTDAWCHRGRSLLRRMPEPLRSLSNRHHPEIPRGRVTAYTGWACRQRFKRWLRSDGDEARYQHYIEFGEGFGRRVRDNVQLSESGVSEAVYFGYDTGSLEVLSYLRDSCCFTVVDQADPGRVEKQIVLKEIERWPGWAKKKPVLYDPYYERRRKEWDLASAVMVNSKWSKDALVKQGVPERKIHVVPLAYETGNRGLNKCGRANGENDHLQVLWLGTVGLRKGIQYLIKAAQKLDSERIQFAIVGPLAISERAVSLAPSNMTFHGRVSRDEVHTYYHEADVYVLPTLSDGFAITQLEAMAHGLPVIVTPNCARVVEDGVQGFVVPPRDADALARGIDEIAGDRERLREMARNAKATAKTYSIDRVGETLTGLVQPAVGNI